MRIKCDECDKCKNEGNVKIEEYDKCGNSGIGSLPIIELRKDEVKDGVLVKQGLCDVPFSLGKGLGMR